MKRFLAICTVSFALVLSSCNSKPKAPEFKSIENITTSYAPGIGDVTIKGDMVIYNPNGVSFRTKNTKIAVYINQKEVGEIKKLTLTNLKKKSNFNVPFEVVFPADKVYRGFLSQGLGLSTSSNVKFRMEGEFSSDVNETVFKTAVNFNDELKISR